MMLILVLNQVLNLINYSANHNQIPSCEKLLTF